MSTTADQLFGQVQAVIQALEKITAKERGEAPSKDFCENYNSLLTLAKEAMPNEDSRRWPPSIMVKQPSMGEAASDARYVEVHAYLKQCAAVLAEGIDYGG